ncbi:MAG: OmpA family protein [Deltaproteobacteria bacterium]|nr:OmpA family protein [Deltaproteobacteria bacterium]
MPMCGGKPATMVLFVLLAALSSADCVTKEAHDQAMAKAQQDLDGARAQAARQLGDAQQQMGDALVRERGLQAKLADLEQQLAERSKALELATTDGKQAQGKLDEATAINEQLRKELERLGRDVDKLLAEKGTLAVSLADAKVRLEELRKAQEAVDKRAKLFRSLLLKFKALIDAGDLKVVMREGRMVLQLRNDVLFDSGSTAIKKEGKEALEQVAGVLATLPGRKLQVAGHTDNVPIATPRFGSNWELSTGRAVEVVRFLIEKGLKPDVVSAAGYGEHDPVAGNETAEGKARNRRIEIVLQPDLSELVSVPEIQ